MTDKQSDDRQTMAAIIAVEGERTPLSPYTIWTREAVARLEEDPAVTVRERSDGKLIAIAKK